MDTLSTVSIDEDELATPRVDERSSFLLTCNICFKCHVTETDMHQRLPCGHIYLQKRTARFRKKFKSRYEEMCFRMKAIL
jgi:ribosomal protein L31